LEQAEANAAANEDQPGDNQCGAHSRHLADVGGFWDLRKSNRAAKRRLPLCRAPRRLITPAAQQLTGFLPGLLESLRARVCAGVKVAHGDTDPSRRL